MRPFSIRPDGTGLHHAAHATHSAHVRHGRHAATGASRLRLVGDHGFCGDQQTRNRSCVLQRGAHDLRRVDDAGFDQIGVNAILCIEPEIGVLLLKQLASDNGAVEASIFGDLTDRSLESLADDVNADILVVIRTFELGKGLGRIEESGTATGNNAFFDGCTGCSAWRLQRGPSSLSLRSRSHHQRG